MKKLLTLMLALALALTFCCAAAEETSETLEFPETGLVLTQTELMKALPGMFFESDIGVIDEVHHVAVGTVIYTPMDKASIEKLLEGTQAGNPDEELLAEFGRSAVGIYNFASVGGNNTFDSVKEYILSEEVKNAFIPYELGQDGETRFYLLLTNPEDPAYAEDLEKIPEEQREAYRAAVSDAEGLIANIRFGEPEKADPEGLSLAMELPDLDGNRVSTAELFAGHKVTMVNCWATYCGWCLVEMPELQKIAEEYADKGVGVIGICMDAKKENKRMEAKEILKETGVSYPSLAVDQSIDKALGIIGYPTTFFVDETGRVIGEPIIGAKIDTYRPMLDSLLGP